jgi:cell division protein FtsI (penicillin-binding protein 3)
MTERGQRWRLGTLAALMFVCLTGLGARLTQLHAGPNQQKLASLKNARTLVKDVAVSRGRILDRNGRILAMDVPGHELCADPALLAAQSNLPEVVEFLSATLDVSPDILRERLSARDRRFVYLRYGRRLNLEQAGRVGERKLPGIFFQDVMARSYPRGASLCHVLGFVNLEGRGSGGIEQRYDDYLRGIPGLVISELDGRRRELYDQRSLTIPAHDGADVHLTIDQFVQYVVDRALDSAMEIHRPEAAWAVVQRVRTGEILAMSSRPAYDPNDFRKADKEQLRNRCIAYNYEPGSTFKIAVVAAAINEGLVTPATIFDCENGLWMHAGRPLRDYHPYGRLSVADVLKKSSNIGAAKIALLLGPERLYAYLKAFGVGASTGLELPGEEGGILNPLSSWTLLSPTRIAMGHEVAVTSLQMLQMLCAIANDGVAMKPHLVRRVVDTDGRLLAENKPAALRRVISAGSAATMRQMLARVTEAGGTATRARVEGYSVGGKTGTAQKPIPGGYSDTLNMASFVGFIPAEDPELGIIVVMDSPKDFHTGGAVAAPVFKEIAEQTVRYLDIPPDQDTAVALALSGLTADRSVAALTGGGLAREAR